MCLMSMCQTREAPTVTFLIVSPETREGILQKITQIVPQRPALHGNSKVQKFGHSVKRSIPVPCLPKNRCPGRWRQGQTPAVALTRPLSDLSQRVHGCHDSFRAMSFTHLSYPFPVLQKHEGWFASNSPLNASEKGGMYSGKPGFSPMYR